jgi:hypothetical protein
MLQYPQLSHQGFTDGGETQELGRLYFTFFISLSRLLLPEAE